MRRWFAVLAVIVLASANLAVAAAQQSSPGAERFYGLWRTPVDGGSVVRLEPCGVHVCGFIVSSPRLDANPDQRDVRNRDPSRRNRPVRGLKFLEARQVGADELSDGWVYHPIEGNTYSGTVRMLADGRLRLTGCAIWPFCQTQIWTRTG